MHWNIIQDSPIKIKCLKSFIDRKSFPASIITIIDKSTYSFLAAETFHRLTGRVSTNFAYMRMLWKRICTIGRSWKLDWLPFKGAVHLKSKFAPLIQTNSKSDVIYIQREFSRRTHMVTPLFCRFLHILRQVNPSLLEKIYYYWYWINLFSKKVV